MTGEGNLPLREQQIDEMIGALNDYWTAHPYLRLGQLVVNLASMTNQPVWEFDRDDLIAATATAEPEPSPPGDTDIDWLQQQVTLEDG